MRQKHYVFLVEAIMKSFRTLSVRGTVYGTANSTQSKMVYNSSGLGVGICKYQENYFYMVILWQIT